MRISRCQLECHYMQCHIIRQLRFRAPAPASGESLVPITVKPVDAAAIEDARMRLAGLSRITPLIPLDAAPENKTITLKLECLQPIGCFKIRPIGNAVLAKERSS